MTFLAPMSAVVGACLAVPALVALYLLKLRRRPVRVSSTLLWQSAAEDLQANVPLRWVRASWLFLLHLLILTLLVLALGRPTFSAGRDAPARLVLLIDTSASMSCADGPDGQTRLDEARRRASDLASRAITSGAAVAVVGFAARATVETGYSSSRGAVQVAIRNIAPTDQPADLGGALKVVESLLSDQGEESPGVRTSVSLISDGSFEGGEAPALAGAPVSFVPVGSDRADNAGIVAISARREYDDPGTVRVFVRVAAAAPDALDIPLSLSLDGAVVDRRVAHLLPGTSTASQPAGPGAAQGPASAVVTFQLHSVRGGAAVVSIDRADALEADNSAAIILAPARKARIVLVRPADDSPRPTLVPPTLLSDALSELDAASFRAIDSREYERLAGIDGLGGVDLYVFDRVRPSTLPLAASLSFGAGLPVAGLDLRAGNPERPGEFVLAWDRAHPVMRDVALDQVFIASSLQRVESEPGTAAARELATGPSGPLVLLGTGGGAHRRLVVAFDPAASNWPLQVSFAVFLASAVDYLTLRAEEAAGRAYTTGEPVEIVAPPGVARVELRRLAPVAESPRRPSESPVIPVSIPGGRADEDVPVGLVDRAGLYEVVPPGAQPRVAVNLVNEIETACAVMRSVKIGTVSVGANASVDVPREIWLWLVLIAAALLVIEWAVFASRARA